MTSPAAKPFVLSQHGPFAVQLAPRSRRYFRIVHVPTGKLVYAPEFEAVEATLIARELEAAFDGLDVMTMNKDTGRTYCDAARRAAHDKLEQIAPVDEEDGGW